MKFLFQSSIKQFYKLYSKFKWMFETFSTSQINSQYLMDYPQLFKYFKDIKSYLDLNWNSFKIVTMLHISWFSSRFFQFLVHFNLFLSNFTKTKNSVILLTASMHNKQFPFTFPPIKLQFAGYLRTIVYDQSSNIIVTHFELFFLVFDRASAQTKSRLRTVSLHWCAGYLYTLSGATTKKPNFWMDADKNRIIH